MSDDVLDRIYKIVNEAPHSAQSLLLFALIKTLDIQKGGHMYLLAKLKEMTAENRQVAYGLMELMADNRIHDDNWQKKLEMIETAIRSNS